MPKSEFDPGWVTPSPGYKPQGCLSLTKSENTTSVIPIALHSLKRDSIVYIKFDICRYSLSGSPCNRPLLTQVMACTSVQPQSQGQRREYTPASLTYC
jgi:hypothetical protein